MREYPVVICGAGPVGLSMSIMLSRFGIEHLLVEKRTSVSTLPRARGVTSRTAEIWARFGLYDELKSLSLPAAWCHNFIYADTLSGELIGIMPSNCMAPGARATDTRYDFQCCAQDQIDSMLLRAAESYPAATIEFGAELLNTTQNEAGITLQVQHPDRVEHETIHAQWLIGADGGGSPLRDRAGIVQLGAANLQSYINNHIVADLSRWSAGRESVLIWTFGKGTEGVFQPHDGARRWMVQINFDPATDPAETWTKDRVVSRIRKMLGEHGEQAEIDLRSSYGFTISAMVSDRLRDGRLLLVGDAAHKIPPFGGFGMNTGVQTAHNLAWKLAMVLNGASMSLLDSFDVERREVAHRVCQFGHVNGGYIRSIQTAPTREERRRIVAASTQYGNWTGLDLGVHYEQPGAFIADDVSAPAAANPVTEYIPSAKPGHRAPHLWLRRRNERLSSVDLFEKTFVLLTPSRGSGWSAAADGLPIVPYVVGPDGDLNEEDRSFAALYNIESDGAVLVRPDGHVAFRSQRAPQNAAALRSVLERIC